jgi:hypothetical protein
MAGTIPPASSAEPDDAAFGSDGDFRDGPSSLMTTTSQPRATDRPFLTPWPEPQADEAQDLTLPESLPPDPGAPPTVTPAEWLHEPPYWLADYQRVPRPKTRPISRPVRFRKVSYWKSMVLLCSLVLTMGVAIVGIVLAYQASTAILPQFTTPAKPLSAPSVTPASTIVPTATPTQRPRKK